MADVGDIHHMLNRVTVEFQNTTQDIFEEIRAQIPYVSIIVYGQTARVQAHMRWIEGLEFPD